MFYSISPFALSQLGDGSGTNQNTPVQVVGVSSNVTSVSLGMVRLTFDLLVVQTLRCDAVAGVGVALVVFG